MKHALFALLFAAPSSHAQTLDPHAESQTPAALLRHAADQLAGYENFSYWSVFKQKEYTSDTLVIENRDLFARSPGDTALSYVLHLELHPNDSTYSIKKMSPAAAQGSLPGHLHWLNDFLAKKPANSTATADTLLNSIPCHHLIINTYDTLIDNEHLYTRIHVFLDTALGLPVSIRYRSKNKNIGNSITDYYADDDYSDYRFNQPAGDSTAISIPAGFHLPEKQPDMPAHLTPGTLATGTAAPDWTLYAADSKKISLTQLKGKVIMVDFFFIGCYGCMLSLTPLNNLHAKYDPHDVAIVSLTPRDSKTTVAAFAKKYHLGYPIFVDAVEAVASYHVNAFPTFYFIDKQGRIADVIEGYSDGFEKHAASIIDGLLEK